MEGSGDLACIPLVVSMPYIDVTNQIHWLHLMMSSLISEASPHFRKEGIGTQDYVQTSLWLPHLFIQCVRIYYCNYIIGVNLAIYQSGTEVLKKQDIGSKKRDNFFCSLRLQYSLKLQPSLTCTQSARSPRWLKIACLLAFFGALGSHSVSDELETSTDFWNLPS